MKELEGVDILILRALLRDGRSSFRTIAEQCRASEDIIRTHYFEMKKAGIIDGATIQINYPKFGYTGLATIMIRVRSSDVAEVYEKIKKIPDIHFVRYYNSPFNVAAVATLKSLKDLENLKQIINKGNKSKILEFKTQVWTDCRNIPENILQCSTDPPNDNNQTSQNDQKSISVDRIDIQIIDALTINGRQSFSRIASQIGAATSTVARRYEYLKKNNYIKVSIQVNPALLGFQSILEVSMALTDQSEINSMIEEISKIPGLTYLVKLAGTYDLLAVFLVKDCKDTMRITDEIVEISKIEKMESTLRSLQPLWPGPRQYISTL
jgi:DNA-binding Lrp family transcriptional regulator